MRVKRLCIFFIAAFIFNFLGYLPAYALTEESAEQNILKAEERAEDAFQKPDTVDEILSLLKERAKLKLADKRKELLRKKRISASLLTGFENNPLNDSSTKGDYFVEEDFSINWQPTFNRSLGVDVGYWLVNQEYVEQTDLSSFDQGVNATLKWYPFESGRLRLEPGAEYEWLYYREDENSSYEDLKYFLKFKHYIGQEWNYGGKYEHSFKVYDKKQARDSSKTGLGFNREDNRHTGELYITRYLGKYTIKIKGKFYRNTSNDNYQEYYDYDSGKGYLTLSRTFLKDDKLYISFAPSFERKNYHHRVAVDTARHDDIREYKLSANYSLNKNISLSYTFSHKEVDSNYTSGEYHNVTNKIGASVDF
jgi:hypothetical protein